MKLSAFCSLISGIISIGVTVFLAAGCRLFSGANKASFWLMAVCLAIVIVIAWKIFYFFLKKIICSSKLLILLEDSGLILFRVKDGNIEFFKKLHRGEKFDDLKLGDVLKEHVFLQTSMVFNEEKVFTVFDPDNPEDKENRRFCFDKSEILFKVEDLSVYIINDYQQGEGAKTVFNSFGGKEGVESKIKEIIQNAFGETFAAAVKIEKGQLKSMVMNRPLTLIFLEKLEDGFGKTPFRFVSDPEPIFSAKIRTVEKKKY